jgi:elongation factor P hydroxylase
MLINNHVPEPNQVSHNYKDLIILFNHCFAGDYNTRLLRGGNEPEYLPSSTERPYNALFFAHGFYSSALHECAHWFIAGAQRRKLVDFGYWYSPDGRTEQEQVIFQQVEVKPQAIEWILSRAANHSFRVSIDNLNGVESDTESFKKAIYQQALSYCANGLPKRAEQFRKALCHFYKTSERLCGDDFSLQSL